MNAEALERYRALELAQQVDEATDQLWATGKPALALRLLYEDAQRLVTTLQASSDVRALDVSALAELCRHGAELGLPVLERDLTPAHEEFLDRLASNRRRCVAQLRRADSRSQRFRASLLLLLSLAAFGVGSYVMLRNVPTASASGTYNSDFPAEHALDGLSTTEWLLPDQQTGWLELAFSRPRDVRTVRLENAVNGHYRDRAAKAVRIEAYERTVVVATAHAELPPIAAGSGPITVPVSARDVTKLRISIESFYGSGGGLAEVRAE